MYIKIFIIDLIIIYLIIKSKPHNQYATSSNALYTRFGRVAFSQIAFRQVSFRQVEY